GCLGIISVEAEDPIRGEFKDIVHDLTVGLPLHQSVESLAARIPLAEAKLVASAVSMQGRPGRRLSDALSGLSKVLRDRQKIQAKIGAMSAGAKTSAGIIGAMPVGVLALMSLASPHYIEPVFTAFAGNIILAACVVWMMVGAFVMW